MSEKLSKYIVTTGMFDNETNNLKHARQLLKNHAKRMKVLYPNDKDTYAIYKLVEKSE